MWRQGWSQAKPSPKLLSQYPWGSGVSSQYTRSSGVQACGRGAQDYEDVLGSPRLVVEPAARCWGVWKDASGGGARSRAFWTLYPDTIAVAGEHCAVPAAEHHVLLNRLPGRPLLKKLLFLGSLPATLTVCATSADTGQLLSSLPKRLKQILPWHQQDQSLSGRSSSQTGSWGQVTCLSTEDTSERKGKKISWERLIHQHLCFVLFCFSVEGKIRDMSKWSKPSVVPELLLVCVLWINMIADLGLLLILLRLKNKQERRNNLGRTRK